MQINTNLKKDVRRYNLAGEVYWHRLDVSLFARLNAEFCKSCAQTYPLGTGLSIWKAK